MTKIDIVKQVAKQVGITQPVAKKAVEAVFEAIKNNLAKTTTPVTLRGFGTFFTQYKTARMGRNPKTGKPVEISARLIPRFKPSDNLKDLINRKDS